MLREVRNSKLAEGLNNCFMEDFKFSKNVKKQMLVAGYYQIIGGIIGLGLLIWTLINLDSFQPVLLVIFLPAFLLFFFSVYCGYLLVSGKISGGRLSIINQFLQLFSFAFGGYAYQYISGLGFTIGFDLTDSFNFIFYFGISSWKLNFNTDSPLIQLEFNLIALYVIFALIKLKRQVKTENERLMINSIISEY
jgi:hypothetical protein